MERLTKRLIDVLPTNPAELSLRVDSLSNDGSSEVIPGVMYNAKLSGGEEVFGSIKCSSWFSSDYTKARIVASEAVNYFRNLGIKVIIEMNL